MTNHFVRVFKQTCGNISARETGEGPTNLVLKSDTPTMDEVLNLMMKCGAVEGTPLLHTIKKIVMKLPRTKILIIIDELEHSLRRPENKRRQVHRQLFPPLRRVAPHW
jgi:hypothetical protein